MDSTRNNQGVLSKYALSNIILFLSLKEALKIRQVAKKFDDAVLLGLNALYFDLGLQADRL